MQCFVTTLCSSQDEELLRLYSTLKEARKGRPDWTMISLQLGTNRTPENCRLRFTHVLEPRLAGLTVDGPWSAAEVCRRLFLLVCLTIFSILVAICRTKPLGQHIKCIRMQAELKALVGSAFQRPLDLVALL
jgi:hypothetical protein